jgi:hypothetical protein
MNRCLPPATLLAPAQTQPASLLRIFAALLALLAMLWLAPAAHAQTVGREAPKDVKFGQLTVTQPPEVMLDDKPDRLSPGSRIRGTNHMLIMSGSVVGKTMPVVYRRDAAGLIHEAWVLTPEEAARVSGTPTGNGAQALSDLLSLIFGARR